MQSKEQTSEGIGGVAAALIADLAEKATEPRVVEVDTSGLERAYPKGVPFLFDGLKHAPVSLKAVLEEYRLWPERRTGTARVETLQSFIDLVNRHQDSDSVIFGRTAWPDPALTAIIDYHHGPASEEGDPLSPRHLKHRVHYAFPVTEELKAWIAANGKPMEQAEFAAFLEEHAAELASPFDGERTELERLFKERLASPAELIALSRELEIHAGAKVKRKERLSSGERTVYFAEEHMTGDGQPVDIPGAFVVAVPAFLDGEPVRIPARLRYRLAGGGIHWFYQLYRWEFWLRDRVCHDLQAAGEKTGLPVFEGAPEG